jgi:hypothetical protein
MQVVLYTRKRLTRWDLNLRDQLINTPNTDIIYLYLRDRYRKRNAAQILPVNKHFELQINAPRYKISWKHSRLKETEKQ